MKTRLLLLFLATAILSSCKSTAMKGSPFYSGEYSNVKSDAQNRLNLWPLAYVHGTAVSVLWPFFEFSAEHLAVRPLFSKYRLHGPNSPYEEINIMWPLGKFKKKSNENRFFPFFWGHDPKKPDNRYFNIAPLYWSKHQNDNVENMLFPLWNYKKDKDGYQCNILGPLIGITNNRSKEKFHIWPFYGAGHSRYDKDSFWWVASGLVGAIKENNKTAMDWVIPFYFRNNNKFISLPYTHLKYGNTDQTIIPLLLSSYTKDLNDDSLRIALGLYGRNRKNNEVQSSWLFPIYYRDHDQFYSPLYVHKSATI